MSEAATTDLKTFGNPPVPVEDVVDEQGNTYCQIHTDRETGLRCNNCTRLMCASCAVSTPVGYRCEQCVRQREDTFFNADTTYYVKLLAVTTVTGVVGAFVANLIPFFLFAFFIGAAAGGVISEAAMRVTKGQRGRYTAEFATGGVILGAVIVVLLSVLPFLSMVSSASLSPEEIAQITQQYGAETAEEIVQEIRQQQGGVVARVIGAAFLDISLWLYTGVAAVTVYGRFNIYGGRRRRR
ncbi:MAG: B-box zinc finger protein [Chloroflexota bacterium]